MGIRHCIEGTLLTDQETGKRFVVDTELILMTNLTSIISNLRDGEKVKIVIETLDGSVKSS